MINYERSFIMDENIQHAFLTRNWEIHKVNVRGVGNITEAVFEAASSLMKGGIETDDGKVYQADDIIGWFDIPG